MSVDVVVVGAGGFGRETLDVIEAHNRAVQHEKRTEAGLRVIGVADDFPNHQNLRRLEDRDYRYLGKISDVIDGSEPQRYSLAIGDPWMRSEVDKKFIRAGWKAVTVVHPSATLGSQVLLGEGSIVCSGAQISTNTQFGRHVHVNPNATIGHDTHLADYVSVNPGAVISGEVSVERVSLVGASSVILQGLEVGSGCVIGASACVVTDVAPNTTVVGIPARPMQREPKQESLEHEGSQ